MASLADRLRLLVRARTERRRPLPPPEPGAGVPAQAYEGDYEGPAIDLRYSPEPDGDPDPGEVVWAEVPFEEDHDRSKDRPVLVVARDGRHLLALPMTSKDHDRDAAQEAAAGRHWVDVGTGAWDDRGRPSEVRVDRLLRLDPARVRREGAGMDRQRFERVATAARSALGWD